MATILTLDASVFAAACRPDESGHDASRALLRAVRDAGTPLVEPAILPVEIAAALKRTGEDTALAREYAEAVMSLPHLTLLAIDARLARRAVDIAVTHGLRGADALYVAAATHYGARLITLDTEHLRRSPPGVGALSPEAALALLK